VDRVRKAAPEAFYACDPGLGEEDTGLYVESALAELTRDQLVPRADILCPNGFELARIVDGDPAAGGVSDIADQAAAALSRMRPDGRGLLLLTSVRKGDRIGAALFARGRPPLFVGAPTLPGVYRGAGDLLTALFVGHLTLGRGEEDALSLAVSGLYAALSGLNRSCQAANRAPAPGDDLPVPRHAGDFAAPPVVFRPEPLPSD